MNKIKTKDLSRQETPYSHYHNTEEWAIIEHLLNELETNQDIEVKNCSGICNWLFSRKVKK